MNISSKERKGNLGRMALKLFAVLVAVATGAMIFLFAYMDSTREIKEGLCLSNIKHVSMASILYSADSNDCLPPFYTFDGQPSAKHFMDVTMEYAKQDGTYRCPTDQGGIQPTQEGLSGKMSYVHSLSLRGVIPKFSTGNRVLKNSEVKEPSQQPFLRDPIRGYGIADGTSSNNGSHSKNPHFVSPHGTRFTLSYMDGHVKSKGPIDEFKEL